MKKTLLLTSMLLAVTVSVALAASGVNFNWGTNCYTDAPVSAKVFACNVNTGSFPMTASFAVSVPMPNFVGVDIKMEGQSDQPALPDWWKLGATGDCRTAKAGFNANFSTLTSACIDWYATSTLLVGGYSWETNKAHVVIAAAIDAPMALDPDVEYYAGQLTVLNSKTVGTGLCAGCSFGMKWGLYEVMASGNDGQQIRVTEPLANQCLDWNNTTQLCAAPVPARNTTWGQVKSLYR
jgi:hypothetical protein